MVMAPISEIAPRFIVLALKQRYYSGLGFTGFFGSALYDLFYEDSKGD
jgi:hypothetical protein